MNKFDMHNEYDPQPMSEDDVESTANEQRQQYSDNTQPFAALSMQSSMPPLSVDILMQPLKRNRYYYMHKRTFESNKKIASMRMADYTEILTTHGIRIDGFSEELQSYKLVLLRDQI